MAYKALVCRVSGLRPIPGADRIKLASVGGYSVIVGPDVREGELGVLFEAGGQLSEEFASVNDLVKRKLPDGTQAGGMFEENRRVKAIKLKGCKSEGFWCPMRLFEYTGYDLTQLREGDQFDELNGRSICTKYITPATRRRIGSQRSQQRREVPMFAKHVETEQFRASASIIPEGAILYFSEKLHGTSFRYGHVREEREPQGFREKCFRFLGRLLGQKPEFVVWHHLNGTRNTICEKFTGQDFYGNDDFRLRATEGIRLKKGEVLYGELVGYTRSGAPIMAPQSTAALKDKSITQKYGPEMVYRYGCIPGQCKMYIYRITQVNEDGQAVELSWPQVVARCKELGLETVPVFDYWVYDGDLEALEQLVDRLTNGESGSEALPSRLDPSHIQEGIVLRVESEYGTDWLKNKSFVFGVLEGYLKEKDDYVDVEEAA